MLSDSSQEMANHSPKDMSRAWSSKKRLLYQLRQRFQYQSKAIRLRKLAWDSIDREFIEVFLSTSIQEQERYSRLFSYLASGLLYYGTSDCARAYYPGASSTHEAVVDAMEGFCRVLPMVSAWICSGRPSVIRNFDGEQRDLMGFAKEGLLAGTNPKSNGFWGNIGDRDQRIVEAADIALSVWLLRGRLWPQLSSSEKEIISKWLLSVNGKSIPDNNWHLFPILVNEVLFSLGYPGDRTSCLWHYRRLKSFYQGDGWFSDGPGGSIDYYNAWCIHYALFWINLINPTLDPEFIDSSLNEFVRSYKYFFSTEGIPITGRSICYRMAAPAPLIAAATRGLSSISAGMARRALDCVWKHFVRRGAVRNGRITQGYWQQEPSLLDNYSGPGSSLWSTRSLTLAFYNPPRSNFWTAPLEALPVEQDDFAIIIPAIRWEIRGFKLTGEVQIIKKDKNGIISKPVKTPSLRDRFLVSVLGLPHRPQNRFAVNDLHKYSSLCPFWLTESLKNGTGVEEGIPG